MQPGPGQDPYQQQYPAGYGQVPQYPDPTFAPQSAQPYSTPPAGEQYPTGPAEYSLQPEYAQPQYQQPQYPQYPQTPQPYPGSGYPVPPTSSPGQFNTFGLLSLIFGIVSIPMLFCCLVGVPLAIAGVVLGVLGVGKANSGQATNKGMSIAGIACSAGAIVLLIVYIAFNAAGMSALPSTLN
jgi:hypothetical protein